MSNGFKFVTRSTLTTRETIKMDDGKEYPLVQARRDVRVAPVLHRRAAADQRNRPGREVPPEVRPRRQGRLTARRHRSLGRYRVQRPEPRAGPAVAAGRKGSPWLPFCFPPSGGAALCLLIYRRHDATVPRHRTAGRQAAPLGAAAAVRAVHRCRVLSAVIPGATQDAAGFGIALSMARGDLPADWLMPNIADEPSTSRTAAVLVRRRALPRRCRCSDEHSAHDRRGAARPRAAVRPLWYTIYALGRRPGVQPSDPFGASASQDDFGRAIADFGLLVLLATFGRDRARARDHRRCGAVGGRGLFLFGAALALERPVIGGRSPARRSPRRCEPRAPAGRGAAADGDRAADRLPPLSAGRLPLARVGTSHRSSRRALWPLRWRCSGEAGRLHLRDLARVAPLDGVRSLPRRRALSAAHDSLVLLALLADGAVGAAALARPLGEPGDRAAAHQPRGDGHRFGDRRQRRGKPSCFPRRCRWRCWPRSGCRR